MKWLAAFATLALAPSVWARGLKTSREPEVGVVWSKELEADNEALRKRNRNLESMMQMARAEVQRMDAASRVSAHAQRRENCGDGDVEVLKQEIEDMKNKLRQADADKNDLVQSLRHMLAKNSTQTFQRQAQRAEELAERAQEAKMALELKCGNERQALEAQLQTASSKCDDTKEVAQKLQEANVDLQKKLEDAQAELAKTGQSNKELGSDKKNLLTTMQRLMRDNSRFKHGLENATAMEKKQATELSAEKALVTKLSKKTPSPTVKKQVKTALKFHPRHHQPMSKAQRAHMKDIDKYIDSAEPVSDDDEQQVRGIQRQADLIAKGKVGTHLSDWLGLKAQPKAPAIASAPLSSVKAPAKPKAEADDGGEAEAEELVVQAKNQLAAMERDDP